MATTPSFESLNFWQQIFVVLGGMLATAFAWIMGMRGNNGAAQKPSDVTSASVANLIATENDKLREEIEQILFRHREGLDNRITQQSDGIKLAFERMDRAMDELKDEIHALSERLRLAEIEQARMGSPRK